MIWGSVGSLPSVALTSVSVEEVGFASDLGDMVRTPILMVSASPTITLGSVSPHVGTAWLKNASLATT